MSKPITPSRGRCKCRMAGCKEIADIKTVKNHPHGALFLSCPVHGMDRAQGAAAQAALDDWITDHAIPEGAELEPEPEPAPTPERAEPGPGGPEPATPATAGDGPEPSQDGPGFFAQADQQLDELFSKG